MEQNKKSILIIGAGVAGLSTGIYGQMNGYQTQIFEMHTLPGGLCTAWKRKGYTIDGCIHWLVGSGSGNMRQVWEELGAAQGRTMVNHEEYARIIGPDGKVLIFYTNVDRLERHMLELAPEDAAVIKEFCNGVRVFTKIDMPIGAPEWLGDVLKMLPMVTKMPVLQKYSTITTKAFSERFKNSFLRQAFMQMYGYDDFPVTASMFALAYMHNHNAGYPIGGSLEFARGMEKRYLSLGGKIEYGARVEKILVRDGKAYGIKLADGREYSADVIVSAADGYATIFKMLDGKYADDEIRGYYEKMQIFEPLVQISFGVNRDFSGQPHMVQYMLEKPVQMGGVEQKAISFKHYAYDPTLAPEGKTVVEVMMTSRHAYWKKLAEDPERYETEKKQLALTVMKMLDGYYPGFSDQVEMVDVATPLTYERYTGNWQGSFEGWLITTEVMKNNFKGKAMKKTLPGLENFYMVGQWVEPGGGLPPAATSGRGQIQLLCKKDKKKFVANRS
jgi:phytoene dehydrogenase-like protein